MFFIISHKEPPPDQKKNLVTENTLVFAQNDIVTQIEIERL